MTLIGGTILVPLPQTASLDSSAKAVDVKGVYGLALGYTLPSMSQQSRIKQLQQIRKYGFTEVRFNLDWSIIQQTSGDSYDWRSTDLMMSDVKNAGLSSIVTLDRTPVWARPANCTGSIWCAPANSSDFAAFSATAVSRYRDYNVDAWEIWNEPNIVNFWKPQPSISQYSELLTKAYVAIKQQVPTATVITAGLAGDPTDNMGTSYIDGRTFLNSLYASGVRNYFDGVAYHPYTKLRLPSAASPYNGWLKMYQTTPSIRSIMTANGDGGKGVWLTEFGAPTDGAGAIVVDDKLAQLPPGADHVTQAIQSHIAQAAINDVQKQPWIRSFDWYTYMDIPTPGDISGGSYGLFEADGKPKLAYYAFKRVLQ